MYHSKLDENQTVEMTLNLKRICSRIPWAKKANRAVAKLKTAVQRHFNEKNKVVITNKLNNFIFARGNTKIPNKIRIKVSREADVNNAEENVFKTDLVVVGSFKGLKEIIVDE